MRTILQTTIATLVLLSWLGSVHAKGIPNLVVIKSVKLQHPIEITDRETLNEFSPWSGKFIDWKRGVVPAPTDQKPQFEVLIYMKSTRGDLRLIYTVMYCPQPDNRTGYIYLPGKDDSRYSTNVSTILRDGDDGKWHLANPAWEATVKRLLEKEKSGSTLVPH
ncbi:MAG: hypothetical protein C5B44_04230 [Acidobacteria bacterium]|nr:MAG: hypothetical protein C5B44_04230 [Acidobacteriota bacterium]